RAGFIRGSQCQYRPRASYRQLENLRRAATARLAQGFMMLVPHLCVVGHPNKGKSSIVSTLTENDSVRIGTESGTTTNADSFEFMLDQRVLLRLTDTPGFQRARQVLSWL